MGEHTSPGIYLLNASGEMTPLSTEDGGDEALLKEVLQEHDAVYNDGTQFTERQKAIIETALMHFSTDAAVNGTFNHSADARKVAEKVRGWRDEDGFVEAEE